MNAVNNISDISNQLLSNLSKKMSIYSQSPELINIFENLVRKPFNEHQRTNSWQREVLDSYTNNRFERIKEIVGRGQANFDEPFNELTPDERVLVYCYDNMQQHVVSKLYILKKHAEIFDKYFFASDSKLIFLDFGCGSLSSGIALARYYTESPISNGQSINFHYIGIDRAESMLRKAREFSLYPGLFHSDSTFNFLNPYANYQNKFYNTLCYYIDMYTSQNHLIILNFSYFFASPSLVASKLINFIQELLLNYSYSQVCLIFQNPQGRFNQKWILFQNGIQDLRSVINGPVEDNFEYYDLTNQRQRTTQLYYDIRFR